MTKSMIKSMTKSMTKYNKFFNPSKMLLLFPVLIMLIFFILMSFYYYDPYSDIRKRFRGHMNIVPKEFEMKSGNFLIYGPSNSGKTTFIKEYCSLYETVNEFCRDAREWKRYSTFSVSELHLLNHPDDSANSLVIIDDMGENIRLPSVNELYSSGRHNKINIM